MKKQPFVFFRPSWKLVAAATLLAAACGKSKDRGGNEKLVTPAAAADAPPTDKISEQSAAAAPLTAAPAWTREDPHYFKRDGRDYASAVGRAKAGDVALSRNAAEDRARVELLRFIRGAPAEGKVEGVLRGARVVDTFTAKDGEVFVRLEIENPQKNG